MAPPDQDNRENTGRRGYDCQHWEAVCRALKLNEDDHRAYEVDLKTKAPVAIIWTISIVLFSLLVSILNLQWTTHKDVGEIKLEHEKVMGEINVSIIELKSEVRYGNTINASARETIKQTLDQQTKITEEKMRDLKKQIDRLNGNTVDGKR